MTHNEHTGYDYQDVTLAIHNGADKEEVNAMIANPRSNLTSKQMDMLWEELAERDADLDQDDATDGDPDEMVTVETMPDCHRASHRAANNWGVYPMNGAEREEMSRADADEVIAADPDGYAHIV